jgi:hypothetical protein
MIIPMQFAFNCPGDFREEAFSNMFPIGSNVKLCPAVSAILNFIMIKVKLYMNVHWMVLYKLYVFSSDMKFKMAATAGIKSINVVEDLPMTIPGQFGFYCPSGFREEAF